LGPIFLQAVPFFFVKMLIFGFSLPVRSNLFSAWTSKRNILFGPWLETVNEHNAVGEDIYFGGRRLLDRQFT